MAVVLDPEDRLIETEPGGGDLRRNSVPYDVFLDSPFIGGRPISYASIFRSQPWVAIAVMRLLTWSVRVPLKVYRRIDDEQVVRLRPDDHPLAAAVSTPWDRGHMAALITSLLGPLLVHGNSLTNVHEGAGGQIRFESVDWRMVTPIRWDDKDPNAEILGWNIRRGKEVDEASADTVMHAKWWSPLGPMGVSPLEQIRTTIDSEEAAVQWSKGSMANTARPSGVVVTDEKFLSLEPWERQALLDQTRSDLRAAYSGGPNAGRLAVLPPGLSWESAPRSSAVEAELIAQRQVNRNEVAAIYMIPPPMIGQLERATYANIQTQRQMAYTDGLAPPLAMIEQTINAHVVQGLLRESDVYAEFDFAGILRGDRLKEIQALREGIGSGLIAPNEGRQILNYPRVDHDNADKTWMPLNNLKPIDTEIPSVKGAR